jgi:LAO/AO transport system kinase
LTIAVIAVDPSSAQSGGSILGDRTRIQGARTSPRVFFRSQASSLMLGGLSRTTFAVCRLLERLFDLVLLETVGVGQNEIEVCHVAQHTWLVMPPLGGDHVQWMKAGIMEIPDVLILNKSDQSDLANRSYHSLRSALALAQPGFRTVPPIIRTSALTGKGVDELVTWLNEQASSPDAAGRALRARYFFQRWLMDEFGRAGWRRFEQRPDHLAVLAIAIKDFEGAQALVTATLT